MHRKKIFLFMMILLPIALFFVGGEVAMRIYYGVRYGARPLSLDDELGWRPTANIDFHGYRKDAEGKAYKVDVRTDKRGFTMFGNAKANRKKKRVLFVGDSYTHGMQVSNDKTYYGILSQALSIEAFAIGCGGYGTLQEYLVLDEFIDLIRPDAIVIQFCYNDFMNNSYELELKSEVHNNGMRRPYLNMAEEVVYAVPARFQWLRHMANRYSRFLYFIFSRLDRIWRSHMSTSAEKRIAAEGRGFLPFNDSVRVTEKILRKIRERAGPGIHVYAFSVDQVLPYYEAFVEVSKATGIQFIDGIPQAVRSAEEKGVVARMDDGMHWNEAGHRLAAGQLMKYFKKGWKSRVEVE